MLVVHAGPHKTATTYIQANLQHARLSLIEKGWLYPSEGTDGWDAHHPIAHGSHIYLDPASKENATLAALGQRAKAEGQNIVFSAEGFCRWGRPKLRKLADLMLTDIVDLVYVIRDPHDVFYSYWGEEVKQGYTDSLPVRFSEHFNDPEKSRLLNPLVDLAPLLRDPKIRVHAVPFNVLKDRSINIYTHLCEKALGLAGQEPGASAERNTALPIELTEFLRVMTIEKAKGKRHIGSGFRNQFMRLTTKRERQEIVDLVKSEVGHLERQIALPGDSFFKRRIPNILQRALEKNWTLDFGQDAIFPSDQKICRYFNEMDLWSNPRVRERAMALLAMIPDEEAPPKKAAAQ